MPKQAAVDQFSGLHGMVIPGTRCGSFCILDGLLEQETALRPADSATRYLRTGPLTSGRSAS
jgi:hypothetical protein